MFLVLEIGIAVAKFDRLCSDPKGGNLSSYTYTPCGYCNSIAPQGDAVRINNYVRLVRTALPTNDSVGDGIPNAWRAQYFGGTGTATNALSCATCDPDHDGVDNLHEHLADTNPNDAGSCFRILNVPQSPAPTVSFNSSTNLGDIRDSFVGFPQETRGGGQASLADELAGG